MDVGVHFETKNVFNCGGYPVDWRSQRSVALLPQFFLSVYTDRPFIVFPLTPHRLPTYHLFLDFKITKMWKNGNVEIKSLNLSLSLILNIFTILATQRSTNKCIIEHMLNFYIFIDYLFFVL